MHNPKAVFQLPITTDSPHGTLERNDHFAMSGPGRWLGGRITVRHAGDLILLLSALVLALAPVANMARIVADTGANNPSNDYVGYVNIVDRVLSGTYDWTGYFRDTFVVSHSLAFPFLIRLAVAKFLHWNIYGELWIAFIASILRLILLYDILRIAPRRLSVLLLPILAAFVFATSQVNTYTYGDAGLTITSIQLAFVVGLWSLIRVRPQWLAVSIMLAAGVIATFSGGEGVPVWPVFLVALIVFRFLKPAYFIVTVIVAGLAALPYVVYMFIQPVPAPPHVKLGMGESLNYIMASIGWPFVNGIGTNIVPTQEAANLGIAGTAALVILVALIVFANGGIRHPAYAAPAIVMMYALATLVLIYWGRAPLIAPWYTTASVTFWIGLVGLLFAALSVWLDRRRQAFPGKRSWLVPLASASVMAFIAVIYSQSNVAYEDKVAYLRSRTPASAACLRNYATAPTYCESQLFQWGVGFPNYVSQLGQPLDKDQLSVFAPEQQWTLQGDWVLNSTRVMGSASLADVIWSADLSTIRVPWSDYHHLNLALRAPNAVQWTVTLPPDLESALFRSAVGLSDQTFSSSRPDNLRSYIYVTDESGQTVAQAAQVLAKTEHGSRWSDVELPLNNYAGQRVTLTLGIDGAPRDADDWAMYQYPRIDVRKLSGSSGLQPPGGSRAVSSLSPSDYQFDVSSPGSWQITGAGNDPTWMTPGLELHFDGSPLLEYTRPLDVPLQDYSHIFVRMGSDIPGARQRALRVYIQTTAQPNWSPITIPLLWDAQVHDYSYDLKLLSFTADERLTGLRLRPEFEEGLPARGDIQLADVRLLHKPAGSQQQ